MSRSESLHKRWFVSYTWVPNMPYFDSDTKKYCSSWKLSHLQHTMKWAGQGTDDLSQSVDKWVKITSKAVLLSTEYIVYGQSMHEHSGINSCIFRLKKTTKGNNISLIDSYKTEKIAFQFYILHSV